MMDALPLRKDLDFSLQVSTSSSQTRFVLRFDLFAVAGETRGALTGNSFLLTPDEISVELLLFPANIGEGVYGEEG